MLWSPCDPLETWCIVLTGAWQSVVATRGTRRGPVLQERVRLLGGRGQVTSGCSGGLAGLVPKHLLERATGRRTRPARCTGVAQRVPMDGGRPSSLPGYGT